MRPEHRDRCVTMIMRQADLNKTKAGKLVDAGYQTGRLLRETTDEELLAIEGIGQVVVGKIRDWVGG